MTMTKNNFNKSNDYTISLITDNENSPTFFKLQMGQVYKIHYKKNVQNNFTKLNAFLKRYDKKCL